MSTVSAAGLCVLVLALASRQAMAVNVDDCVDLLNSAGSSEALVLTADIVCSGDPIAIALGREVTVSGEGNSIEIGTGFSGESLFENEGTLTLDGVTISEATESGLPKGVRAIYNEGTLTVTDCTFRGLNQNSGSPSGGAVSDSNNRSNWNPLTRVTKIEGLYCWADSLMDQTGILRTLQTLQRHLEYGAFALNGTCCGVVAPSHSPAPCLSRAPAPCLSRARGPNILAPISTT